MRGGLPGLGGLFSCNHDESQQKADTVDGAPDHQLNLSREELESAIGPEAAAALWSLPASFLGEAADAALTSDVEIFVRRYTPATRPRGALDADETVRDLPREGPCAECDCTTRLSTPLTLSPRR